MSKKRVRVLKKLVKECIAIADAAVKENNLLKEEVVFHMKQSRDADLRIKELEEACENFVEAEQNLHKKISELEQNKALSIRKRLINFFS